MGALATRCDGRLGSAHLPGHPGGWAGASARLSVRNRALVLWSIHVHLLRIPPDPNGERLRGPLVPFPPPLTGGERLGDRWHLATTTFFPENLLMAMTLRLPATLEDEAADYAASLGLSFNNLVAVALREYLDARPARPSLAPLPDRSPDQLPADPSAAPGVGAAAARKLSPADRLRLKAQAKRLAGGAT